MPFAVMRSPCFPEDEGRHSHVRSFNTKEAAQRWIDKQKGEYYGPSDYYITSPEQTNKPRVTIETVGKNGSTKIVVRSVLDAATYGPVRIIDPPPNTFDTPDMRRFLREYAAAIGVDVEVP